MIAGLPAQRGGGAVGGVEQAQLMRRVIGRNLDRIAPGETGVAIALARAVVEERVQPVPTEVGERVGFFQAPLLRATLTNKRVFHFASGWKSITPVSTSSKATYWL